MVKTKQNLFTGNLMKYFLFIVLLCLGCQLGFAQSVKEAYAYFDRYEYSKSAAVFESVKASKPLKTEELKCLAYSYYVIGDYQKCNSLVDELAADPQMESVFLFYKAESLKALGRYDEAKDAYVNYQALEPADNVEIQILSCDYLKDLSEQKLIVNQDQNNLSKADALYFDQNLGWLGFHECGLDSVRTGLTAPEADNAELMLMRPFVRKGVESKMIAFTEQMDEYSITSFSMNADKTVLFTATNHLSKKPMELVPHLFSGKYNAETATVDNIKLWEWSGYEDTSATAFAAFHPDGNLVVFVKNKSSLDKYSDLYFSELENGSWTKPQALSSANTEYDESHPTFISGDKLQFASSGRPGYGSLDVYETPFNLENKTVGEVSHATAPANSNRDDFWMFSSGDSTLISSSRFGGMGDDDVWILRNMEMSDARKKEIMDSLYEANLSQILSDWQAPKIYFDFDKYNPNTDFSFIPKLVSILNENKEIDIRIEGNTDIRGEEDYNQDLAYMRAKSIANELLAKGIPANRIQIVSNGDKVALKNSKPWSPEAVHKENRYVEIYLLRK